MLARLTAELTKTDLLILDDWGPPAGLLRTTRIGSHSKAVDAKARGRRAGKRGGQRDCHIDQADESNQEMTAVPDHPPAPVAQQGPPARAAASGSGSLRVARGSLLSTTGTGYRRAITLDQNHEH